MMLGSLHLFFIQLIFNGLCLFLPRPELGAAGTSWQTCATELAVASEGRLIGTICSGVFIAQIMISADGRHFVWTLRRGDGRWCGRVPLFSPFLLFCFGQQVTCASFRAKRKGWTLPRSSDPSYCESTSGIFI